MTSPNTHIVYAPDGSAERHSRANARDLVNGAGYSWHPTIRTTPTAYAPFAGTPAPDGPSLSQKVLDSVGGSAAKAAETAAKQAAAAQAEEQERIRAAMAAQFAAAAPAADVEVKDFTQAAAVDASDLDDPADADPDAEAFAAIAVEAEEAPVAEAAPAEPEPAAPAKMTLTEVPRGRGGRKPKAS